MARAKQTMVRLPGEALIWLKARGKQLSTPHPHRLTVQGLLNHDGSVNVSAVLRYQLSLSDPTLKKIIEEHA